MTLRVTTVLAPLRTKNSSLPFPKTLQELFTATRGIRTVTDVLKANIKSQTPSNGTRHSKFLALTRWSTRSNKSTTNYKERWERRPKTWTTGMVHLATSRVQEASNVNLLKISSFSWRRAKRGLILVIVRRLQFIGLWSCLTQASILQRVAVHDTFLSFHERPHLVQTFVKVHSKKWRRVWTKRVRDNSATV